MKKYYLIISILLIFNCSTPYQPYGALGGYKSNELDENTYRVLFKGNQHTKAETVYNYLERRCAEITIDEGYKSIGKHEIIYDAAELSSGVYFYRLKAGEFVDTKKMVILK